MSRKEQNEVSKERILQAALQEFGEKDYVSASTNVLCKQHQISKGLLFHYYKNKEELFLVCTKKVFDDFSQYLEAQCIVEDGLEGGIEERLSRYLEARFLFFRQKPYYENIFITATFNPPLQLIDSIYEIRSTLRETNRKFLGALLDGIVLRKEIQKDEVIKVILEFGDYLQMKYRNSYRENPEEREELIEAHNKSMKMFLNTVFYGIMGEN